MNARRVRPLAAFAATVAVAACGVAVRHQTAPTPATPTTVTTAVEEDGGATAACGIERWAVKTGTDPQAAAVNLTPVDATVASLDALPAPVAPTARVAPVETTVYRVHATVTAYKVEADSDVHLALADDAGDTMIAELPSSGCDNGSPFAGAIDTARRAFVAKYPPAAQYRSVRVPVTLTGVGFFDKIHGQRGVAPNGIELHPVLSLSF